MADIDLRAEPEPVKAAYETDPEPAKVTSTAAGTE